MRISSINMYPDPSGDVLLQGDIVLDHVLILKNVKLIEGQYRWYIQFPRYADGRTVHPISKSFYDYLLQQITEYYHQATAE
ncbi:MAG: septation protein SpoVG family protein [Lacticaseibacillus rhamnosus]|uniref:septation protein SpoVG family protein n=1 Tax=Lacticaseibacillus paracasei TaxID=1597 RepID=UPI0009A26D10|nr:septation protein SpoVG family protein [Lacticaseibacillus paracasei]MDU8969676.1 septation protein SpoVG family protein [Lacticaseibacillus rhamnosus]NLT82703.1 hypothetical protein [Lacticaseibacillus paracasei subsp. paracasei]OPH03622.1 hypothetical protein B4586_10325 [Lacticaseibacillus paracasei]